MHTRIYHAQVLDHRNPRANHIAIVEPPAQDARSARGNLYILVELVGSSPVNSYAVREIQSIIELTYYSAGGAVSAVLKQAIANAHESLRDLNRRSPDVDLEAGIICAAVLQGHLAVASAGSSLALVATNRRLDQFPLDEDRYAGFIGGESLPTVHTYRHKLESGDAFFLGESEWILLSDIRTIGGATFNTSVDNLPAMVEHLRLQNHNVPLLGLLLVYTEEQGPVSDASASARLPTAVGATPPVSDVPENQSGRQIVPFQSRQGGRGVNLPSAPTMQHQLTLPFRSLKNLRIPWPVRTLRLLGSPGKWLAGLLAGLLPEPRARQEAQAGWVGTAPMPQPAPQTPPQPAPQTPPQQPLQPPAIPDYKPPEQTKGTRLRLFILIAILIPLLTAAIIGAAFLREGAINQEEGVQLVQLADSQLLQVQQALTVNDRATARAALSEAQRYLDEAIVLIGVTEQIQGLSEIITTELQDLLQVRALYSLDVPLVEYPSEAGPHRIIVADQDIYMFDSGRQVIEHYRTNGQRTLLEENSGTILREGQEVGGVQVGRLVDIVWQPRITGFAEKASLLALDRNNNVFSYNRLDGATHLKLAGQNPQSSLVQLQVYQGRLYLADESLNQIHRYAPAGLGFEEPPETWFDEQIQINLSGLVAMAIDGDIWLLSEDGTLLRFRQGQQLPFSLESIPGLGGLLVDLALDGQADGLLYLADATQERILVFDKEGRYVEQYVDAEDLALVGLRGLYLDEFSGILYILTRSGLYAHPLPR